MTTFGSVCSGIEAASVAFGPLGWRAAWFSEIEPFPCAVLAHHYPEVPNLGDMTLLVDAILDGDAEAPDVLCGGTPCQAFSVAGQRLSLDDERGNLSLTFCKIANAIDEVRRASGREPCTIFWENVPGVLNTKDNAFGCFLAELAGEDEPLVAPGNKWTNAGYVLGPKRAIAWRTLDAQHFGLAQRRRRVFVAASAREGFDPAAVLFEFDGMRRDTAPSREAGQEAAATLDARTDGGGFPGTDGACGGHVVPVCPTLRAGGNKTGGDRPPGTDVDTADSLVVTHILRGEGFDASEDGTGRGTPLVPVAGTGVKYAYYSHDFAHDRLTDPEGVNPAITAEAHASGNLNVAVPINPQIAMQVRRLTPVECERLQGFPDNWTLIPWRNKPADQCPDGPRYKALGNSWAVPVVRWIGRRLTASSF